MDASRSTVGHGSGDRRQVRCPNRVRERDQGGCAYYCARETRGREACERDTGRPGGRGGGGEAVLCMRDQRGGGLSLCALGERPKGGEGVVHVCCEF